MIQTESLETRVLLTATDGMDLDLSAYSPDNPYSSMMNDSSGTYSQVSSEYLNPSSYSTAIINSPVGQTMGSASSQLEAYLMAGQTSSDQAYQQSMSTQYDAAAMLQNSGGTTTTTGAGSTTNTGSTYDYMLDTGAGTNSTETGTGLTNDTGSYDTGSYDTGSYDTGSYDTGSYDTGSYDTGSNDTGSNDTGSLFPAWKPFQLPQGVEFPVTTLPVESYQQNLFAVQPSGIDTFVNTVTTTSTVGTSTESSTGIDTEDAETLPLTDLTTTVTSEQTYNNANDWMVRQSVTNKFTQNSDSASDGTNNDASGDYVPDTDSEDNGRTGSKTFSITVINGTTTITSFHMSDSFTFSSGSIPGEAESDDPYAIPADWIQSAVKSVNAATGDGTAVPGATSDNTANNSNEDDDDAESETSALPNGSGVFVTASYDVSADVTKSLVTLDDGSFAITYTLAIGFSASFSTRAGGHYTIDESDLDADMLSGLDGLAIDATGDFKFFVSGSVAGSFNATATLPLSANLDDADFAASFQFGTSFSAGGGNSSTITATKNVSSGSASDNNDVYDRVNIKHKTSSSGYFGASFWLGASTETDDASEDTTAVESYTADGGDASDGDASDDENAASDETSPAGSQSATDLIEGDKTGVQFSLAVSSSTSKLDKEKVEWKNSWTGGNNDHYYYQVLESSKVTSGTDSHVKIEIGTEQMLVDFGMSGSDSDEIDQEYIYRADLPMNEFTLSHLAKTVSAYSRDSESHYNVGLILGGDDPGLTNSGGYSTDEEARSEEHWPAGAGIDITKETYHDHGGDVESDEPRRHRRTQQHSGANGVQIDVIFDNPVTTSSMRPPKSLDDILNEYRDRQTQLARLQAELAETTDPDMQKFLQDQINVETNILADITTAALAAGATQADLDQITNEAEGAAENDPIDLQTLDNFNDVYIDSAAPGYFFYLMNPSEMDEGWLRNTQYCAIGAAAVAGSAALILDVAAVYGVSYIGTVALQQLPGQIATEWAFLTSTVTLVGSQQKSVNSLWNRMTEHQHKLVEYIRHPASQDNRGFLANAPTLEIRNRIINGRIAHLQSEIAEWQRQIMEILHGK